MEREELDESPIGSVDEEIPIGSASDDSDEEGLFDAETFKGSFLQEMEKLCRPLKYEHRRHDIYAFAEDTSEDNILAFIEDQQEGRQMSLDLKSPPLAYIIDFQADPSLDCTCKCHLNNENRRATSQEIAQPRTEDRRKPKLIADEPRQEQKPIKTQKQMAKQQQERNWTSLSLKQYKQRIKKKLQQKR